MERENIPYPILSIESDLLRDIQFEYPDLANYFSLTDGILTIHDADSYTDIINRYWRKRVLSNNQKRIQKSERIRQHNLLDEQKLDVSISDYIRGTSYDEV